MKKKLLSAILCVSLMASVLVGCGSGSGAESGKTEESQDAASGEASEDASTESSESASDSGSASGDKVHIEFFNIKSEVVGIYDELIQKFEDANPDIEVEQINVPDATTVLQTRMSTNDMPDVLSHWASDPVFKEMVNNGMLVDLTGQEFLNNIKEGMLETTEYDGKAYCLPISMNAAGVVYNIDIFEANGIEIPTTYEELIEVCKKLQDAGITPFAMFNQASHAGQIEAMLQVSDIENYEDAYAKIYEGTAVVEDYEGFRLAAEKIVELNEYAQEDSFGTTYEQAIADFANEETAMILGGIWMVPTINEDNANLNYSTFAFPASAGMKTVVPYQNDHCLAISESCENKEAAMKFLAFMAETENAQYYADMDGSPSYIEGVETTLVQTRPLLDLFDKEDNLGIWPDQLWQPGVVDNMYNFTDELVQSGDVDAYLQNLQGIFVK